MRRRVGLSPSSRSPKYSSRESSFYARRILASGCSAAVPRAFSFPDRKSTRLNSSPTEIYTLSLHDALPILIAAEVLVMGCLETLRYARRIVHCGNEKARGTVAEQPLAKILLA